MTTALVVPAPGEMDHREAFEIASEIVPAHIDFVTSDLEGFLVEIVAGLNGARRPAPLTGASRVDCRAGTL